ncbi:MAG: trehalose-phosphatase [Desulfobulbus sp.]|jgi:trehalose-phosphatase|uniref:trehalose-phosphatase n=1 Tax=Desulfobulbus sp. TaxID=895 RepID=UPI00284FA988|nr:trehalose-phosphatase [Desulfobulbus sp.]MDR2549689.1 trehalose-phosphatase [Desulfobulbus sp.]
MTNNFGDDGFPFADIPDFWRQVRNATSRFLGLDYDGTLAPFAIEPIHAHPLPGVADLLRNLAASGTTEIAIISGRPAHEVAALLADPPLTIVGSHGFEWWPLNGDRQTHRPTQVQQRGLDTIHDALMRCRYGQKVETKVASIAMHTGGMTPKAAAVLERETVAKWGFWAMQHELEWRMFNGGVEVRCQGRNKGDALVKLLGSQPKDTLAVHLGGDDTDEDAFAVLRGRGFGIKVGDFGKATAAQAHLADCSAVVGFLQTWLKATAST